ncbi:MAG: prolipoprotein diacylglyceryl transferase [Hyphomicrobiaceae bacterium]
MLALPYPEFDPVALSLFSLEIKWYGLSYMAGLLLGWLYIRRLVSTPALWPFSRAPFSADKVDDLLLFMTVGVVVGGRLGFVFLYEPQYYLANPLEIPAVWKGGMAFHGALIGCGVAICLFAWRNKVSARSAMDVCAAAVPLGLIFGRLANFINGELFGRPTDMPWGMVFPAAKLEYPSIEPATRHPSQLYEAALEGLVLFLVIRVLTHSKGALQSPGLATGVFLIGYGCARSFSELFRQFDPVHAFSVYGLTPGIVYSIPMILLGIWFVRSAAAQRTAYA